jgi:siroheme decarboxylase
MHESDQRDRELLDALQGEIPLVSTPFAVIGQMLDMSEKEVIKRTERLKREGVIRHLSPHFDARALGYQSSLVAARVPAERVDEVAAIVSGHPGITQNYLRNNELNLWFTVYVSPHSRLGIEATVDALARQAELDTVRRLPTLRAYRRNGGDGEVVSESEPQDQSRELKPEEVVAVRLLQQDLPLQPRPFDVLARGAAISSEELLSAVRSLRAGGQIRRFGAMVVARKTGFDATAMGVWQVPEDRADDFAVRFARHRAVSHCYIRPAYDDWPYNLYTTVHARSVDECESVINDLAADLELVQKRTLFPVREYKRSRLSFFSPEEETWESVWAADRTVARGATG